MHGESELLSVRVRGPWACFTRPEFKVERVSYEVMTPSAARGVLEAILWKPAIVWRVRQIEVLQEIRFTSFKRNEVSQKAPAPTRAEMTGAAHFAPLRADDDGVRTQRNTVALREVDYVIRADFALTERAGADDNVVKFEEMFRRRVLKGQCHHPPCLGCREFDARFGTADGAPAPIACDKSLGWMLHDLEYGTPRRARFFNARIERGVVRVPPFEHAEPSGAEPVGCTS